MKKERPTKWRNKITDKSKYGKATKLRNLGKELNVPVKLKG